MLRVLSLFLSFALASATGKTASVSLSHHSLSFDVEASKNRPVSKVITLLKDMQKQLEKDQEEDEEIYNKIACWCKINNKDKTLAIKEQEGKVTQLTSLIEEGVANTQRLATEIENLKKEVSENTESLAKATALREKQLEEFQSEEKDLLESVGALKSAIVVLSKHNKAFLQSAAYTEAEKKKEKQMLLSLKSVYDRHHDEITSQMTPEQSRKLQQLIQQAQAQAPSVAQYGNQSGEIFGILKNMKETFESNLSVAQENEKVNSAAFADLKSAKQQEINAGQAQVDDKIVQLADTKERVATGRQDLEDTRNSLSADDEFLQMVQEKCSKTDADWQERQKTRQEEIYAVSEAISVLSDDSAHDTFTKTFNPSFLQIVDSKQEEKRAAAAKALLKVKSADPKLALLAQSIKLDAFVKVKAAIDEMVVTLQAEKAEEIKHRDFCINELNENEKTQAQLSRDNDSLTAKVDEIKAAIANAKTEIKEIEGHNTEMRTQLKRAGEDREKQNAEFQTTLADQRVTKKLLTQALTVLKSFYEKQTRKSAYNVAVATAEGQAAIDATFIQMSLTTRRVHHGQQMKSIKAVKQEPILSPEEETDPIRKLENMKGSAAPEGFRTYQKNEGNTSVLGLLQQIIHDTELMEQEISNAEQQSQETYESMVKETNNSLTKNQSALVNQNQAVARAEQELMDTEADLKDTILSMEQESNTGADLHANCDFVLKNFEIRQTARDEEVEALQQAKAILSGAKFDDIEA
jgi:hypothetical protein